MNVEFFNLLNLVRTGKATFHDANSLFRIIYEAEGLEAGYVDIAINDIGVALTDYWAKDIDDATLCAEHLMYSLQRIMERHPQKAAAIYSILEKGMKVKIANEDSNGVLCIKIALELADECEKNNVSLSYKKVEEALVANNDWIKSSIKAQREKRQSYYPIPEGRL